MLSFILRRFLALVAVLFCVVTSTFFLVQAAPGSPFSRERKMTETAEAALRQQYNLDGSPWQNYTAYMGRLLHGDLGPSIKYRGRTVNELLGNGLPVSTLLGLTAFIIATTLGIWFGALAALRQHTWLDHGSMLGALALISLPPFVVGPVLVLVFALGLGWLPVGGWSSWKSLILPALTLAGPYVAYIARLMRSSLMEVLTQDFIRTARAKGLADSAVVARHALKVALLPVVSFLGPLCANLLTGSIVVETIFNIPGAGPYFVNSILNKDIFLLGGITIIYCTLLVFLNFIVDIAYTWLDRRIALYE
jgi:oligopeptide transport system permease protein